MTGVLQTGLDITTGSIGVGLTVLNTGREPNGSDDENGSNWLAKNIAPIAAATALVHLWHYLMGGADSTNVYGTAAAVTQCAIEATTPSEHRRSVATAALKELAKQERPENSSVGKIDEVVASFIRTELATRYDGFQAAALLRGALAKIQASVTAQASQARLGESKSIDDQVMGIETLAEQRVQQCLTRLAVSVGS